MQIIQINKKNKVTAMWPFNKTAPESNKVNDAYDPSSITPEQALENLKKQITSELMRVGRLGANTNPNGKRGSYNTELHYAFEELYKNNPYPRDWKITRKQNGDNILWEVTN